MLTEINGKYQLELPEHRALRPEWDINNGGWEVGRIDAMMNAIGPDDIVFDIGTEEGDISGLLVKYTGCKIVLFEPNERVWPIITKIWEMNNLPEPLDFFGGFLSNVNKAAPLPLGLPLNGDIVTDHGFKQLYENYPDVAQITLDSYCDRTNLIPNVITMDVEGSEWEVLKGGEQTLKRFDIMVFVSVHPVFMKEHYGQEVGEMLRWMHNLGYEQEVIELDYHELHVLFTKK